MIIKDDLPIYHVSEFSEIPKLLEANPDLISVLILDQWMQQDDFYWQVIPLLDQYPMLQSLTLLDKEPDVDRFPLSEQHRYLVGKFDPTQFLEIVRGLLIVKKQLSVGK